MPKVDCIDKSRDRATATTGISSGESGEIWSAEIERGEGRSEEPGHSKMHQGQHELAARPNSKVIHVTEVEERGIETAKPTEELE